MPKTIAEHFGSRLKVCILLQQSNEICLICYRQNDFKEFFFQENDLVFCNDVCCAIEAVGHKHNPTEGYLLIDSSRVRLKAVILHNGNKFQSVLLDCVANMKESCENMKLLLEKIH